MGMIDLYHGSPIKIDRPDPSKGKLYRDFGRGFYVAEWPNDSITIAVKRGGDGWLFKYEADYDAAVNQWNVLEFDNCSLEWAHFVFNNRMQGHANDYDIVIGPTAGGHINDLFEKYRAEQTEWTEKIGKEIIRVAGSSKTDLGPQWCFTDDTTIRSVLHFRGSERVRRG